VRRGPRLHDQALHPTGDRLQLAGHVGRGERPDRRFRRVRGRLAAVAEEGCAQRAERAGGVAGRHVGHAHDLARAAREERVEQVVFADRLERAPVGRGLVADHMVERQVHAHLVDERGVEQGVEQVVPPAAQVVEAVDRHRHRRVRRAERTAEALAHLVGLVADGLRRERAPVAPVAPRDPVPRRQHGDRVEVGRVQRPKIRVAGRLPRAAGDGSREPFGRHPLRDEVAEQGVDRVHEPAMGACPADAGERCAGEQVAEQRPALCARERRQVAGEQRRQLGEHDDRGAEPAGAAGARGPLLHGIP
jgi:hypothetical protein